MAEESREWFVRSQTELGVSYKVSLVNDSFSCTCPDFQFRGGQCKHIRKAKRILAGEAQKDKLPGVKP